MKKYKVVFSRVLVLEEETTIEAINDESLFKKAHDYERFGFRLRSIEELKEEEHDNIG